VLVAPRTDSTGSHLLKLNDRYLFATPGTPQGSAVRFVNVLASKETVDVYYTRTVGDTLAVNNLRFRRESAFVTVPTGGSTTFYVSRYTSRDSVGTPVTIVGEPNRQYTVLVHDSLSRVAVTRVEDN
jgi:hypothetical protein